MQKVFGAFFFFSLNMGCACAQTEIEIHTVAEGLDHPWSLAFLPDGRLLVTERVGRLRIVQEDGNISPPVLGLPEVFSEGQGGLLDIVIDPHFTENQLVYFSYAQAEDGLASTAVARARLIDQSLEDLTVIFRQDPKTQGGNHFGSRLVFASDDTLFVTLGERFTHMEQAQNLQNHLGTIIRIAPDGSIPSDNPFVNNEEALAEIWSYGHRNIQGATLHPGTGELWISEHGPRGGDEINIVRPGQNYGWPEASYGVHYSMIPIPDGHTEQGFIEPLYSWTPSIAPSGMVFYTGTVFPEWQGNLFTGALAGRHLARLTIENGEVVEETKLLEDYHHRIRDVVQGPQGCLYVLTDSDNGQILRLSDPDRQEAMC